MFVLLSVSVTIAPLPFFPTMVSISQSPNRVPSASAYAYTSGDIPDFGRTVGPAVSVVFHLMTAMGGESAYLVGADVAVYEFVGDILATAFHVSRDLFRRPVLFFKQI